MFSCRGRSRHCALEVPLRKEQHEQPRRGFSVWAPRGLRGSAGQVIAWLLGPRPPHLLPVGTPRRSDKMGKIACLILPVSAEWPFALAICRRGTVHHDCDYRRTTCVAFAARPTERTRPAAVGCAATPHCQELLSFCLPPVVVQPALRSHTRSRSSCYIEPHSCHSSPGLGRCKPKIEHTNCGTCSRRLAKSLVCEGSRLHRC